jgi:hypothetical protein
MSATQHRRSCLLAIAFRRSYGQESLAGLALVRLEVAKRTAPEFVRLKERPVEEIRAEALKGAVHA